MNIGFRNIRFRKIAAYVLALVLFASAVTPNWTEAVYAKEISEEKTTKENIAAVKTVKIWAVERYDKNGKLNSVFKDSIVPTEVTLPENTMLGNLIADITERSITYAAGDYDGRLQGLNGVSNARWRGYVKRKDGSIEGFLNVRDRNIDDGDIIILTTSQDYKDPYGAETFPADLNWDWAENVDNKLNLTLNEEEISEIFNGLGSVIAGKNPDYDNVTENLSFPDNFYTYNGKKYRVSFSSDNTKVISNKGAVMRPEDENDVKVNVTCVLRDVYTHVFTFNVKAYSKDELAIKNVKNLLTWNYISNGNTAQAKIIDDLYLPSQIEGYDGLTITWESSNESAIDASGKVKRPANGSKNISGIKLTADIQTGGLHDSKVISSLTVLAVSDNEVNLDKDILWLGNDWSAYNHIAEGVKETVVLPDKGENGTAISWSSDNTEVIEADGTIYRPDAGEKAATATLTATLTAKITTSSTPVYERSIEIPVTVLPWTDEERAACDEKIAVLNGILEAMNLPDKVNKSNQAEVTGIVVPRRDEIKAAYEAAINAGAVNKEINRLPLYRKYLSAEAGLRKLPKTITVSIPDVTKNGSDYTYSGDYFFEKTKVVISGNNQGEASNDVASVLTGLSNKNYANLFPCIVSASIVITINGTKISNSGDYGWRYAVNGRDMGKISGVSSAKNQTLEQGDNLVIYYTTEADSARFNRGDYVKALPDSYPVDYDFANSEIIDANNLTYELLLGENESRLSVKDKLVLPQKGKCGSKITWSADSSLVDVSTGEVVRGDSNRVVTLTASIESLLKEQTKSFTFIIKGKYESQDEKTLNYAIGQLELKGLSCVTADIHLPENGFGGSVITWESSNSKVLSDSGIVTRPDKDTKVTLTATVTAGNVSGTREFEATVPKKADTDAEKLAYDKENLTFQKICGENLSEDNIKSNLILPGTGVMGSAISWSSDNNAVTKEGVVNRSDKDAQVTLRAELSYGECRDIAEFKLVILGLTDKEKACMAAETAIAGLPDALTVSVDSRKETEALVKEAQALTDEAVKQGNEEKDIKNIQLLNAVKKKLDNLPVTVTFSIVGADIANKRITGFRWFVEKCKLLVPAGTSVADITQAMIKGYDCIREGTGSGYYGSILGLSQFDAGSGSGWIYGGTGNGINTSKGCKESYVDEGSVVYWKYTGDSDVMFNAEEFPMYTPYGDEHPIDKNLVPDTDIDGLKTLIARAYTMSEDDYRNYGQWKNSWDNLTEALLYANKVAEAENTALAYEVNAAIDKLSDAIDNLQPEKIDKTELESLVSDAKTFNENDYYESAWQEFYDTLMQAYDVLSDDYAETSMVSYITESLKKAEGRLMPRSGADKTVLIKLLDECGQYRPEYYSISNVNSLNNAVKRAYEVLEKADATKEEVFAACEKLQTAINNLVSVSNSEVTGNRVINTLAAEWQGTCESWRIFDMQLLGHVQDINEKGYLVNIAAMFEGNVVTVTELEREAVVLTSLGYDVTDITTASGRKINLIENIDNMLNMDSDTVNAIVWALIAVDSGNYEYDDGNFRKQLKEKLLSVQHNDGSWSVEQEYDPGQPVTENLDMTAMAVTALSPYRGEKQVDAAIKKAFELMGSYRNYLSGEPQVNKGNSNVTAMAMIACAAAPEYDEVTLEYMKIGGLRYYITEDNHLGYNNNVQANDMSTEQGVRAYAAYSYLAENNNEPVDIYRCKTPDKKLVLPKADMPEIVTDLTNHTTTDEKISFYVNAATSDGQAADIQVLANKNSVYADNGIYTVEINEGINEIEITAVGANNAVSKRYFSIIRIKETEKQVTVKFSLYGDSRHGEEGHTGYQAWIEPESITVPAGSSVRYVLELMLNKYNMSYTAEKGYIQSINDLWEFDNGSKSGWLFIVNKISPQVGCDDYIVNEGDEIQWYYTDDYVNDDGNRDNIEEPEPTKEPAEPSETPDSTEVPTKEPAEPSETPDSTEVPAKEPAESSAAPDSTMKPTDKPQDSNDIAVEPPVKAPDNNSDKEYAKQTRNEEINAQGTLKKGDIIKDKASGAYYKVISVNKIVKVRYLRSLKKPKKIKKIKIPAYIKYQGEMRCKVKGITKKGFKFLKKLNKKAIIKVSDKKYKYYKKIFKKKKVKCKVVKM